MVTHHDAAQTSQALAQSLQGGGEAGADDAAGALAL